MPKIVGEIWGYVWFVDRMDILSRIVQTKEKIGTQEEVIVSHAIQVSIEMIILKRIMETDNGTGVCLLNIVSEIKISEI